MKKVTSTLLFAAVLTGLLISANSGIFLKRVQAKDFTCSENWRITGYFTPIETDYRSTATRKVKIEGLGRERFNSEFLQIIFNETKGYGEGWGKTRSGWYLGKYDDKWHKSDAPLDAKDQPLKPNSIAVDNSIIPVGSSVKVPDLPGEYGTTIYIANDIGVSVHGKHIDIYTGEGKAAGEATKRITFEEPGELKRVCYLPPEK